MGSPFVDQGHAPGVGTGKFDVDRPVLHLEQIRVGNGQYGARVMDWTVGYLLGGQVEDGIELQ